MRALALVALWLAGCDGPQLTPWWATHSSTIALSGDGEALWLASPDDDRVVSISPETLAVRREVALRDGPAALAVGPDGRVIATLSRGAAVAVIEGDAVRELPIPCGGPAAVVWPGETAFVSCPYDDRVVEIHPGDGVRRVLALGPRPDALASDATRLAITGRGVLLVIERAAIEGLPTGSAPQPVAHRSRALSTQPGFAATGLRAVVPFGGDFVVGGQRVDHDSDRDRPPEQGGYGQLFDATPRIEPRLWGPCAAEGEGRYARFDGGSRVFSGLRALAPGPDGALWAAHAFTDNVALIDCRRGVIGSFALGRGPRGIAVSPDGASAWVDVGFDHAVARLAAADAVAGAVVEAALTRRRTPGPMALDGFALAGRQIFHDAVNTHLTPSGVVACASCHPDGGEDGLSWFLHTPTVARKLRRTPPAYGAKAALAPYHWDGELPDAAELTRATIRGLMDGDGLVVDVAAVAAWMHALPPPPGRPAWDAADAALIERGAAEFAAACAECHPAPLFADGRRHAVTAPSADPDGRLEAVDTPTLRGVRGRAPFLHDGRAADLAAAVAAHEAVTVGDLPALVRYLESL